MRQSTITSQLGAPCLCWTLVFTTVVLASAVRAQEPSDQTAEDQEAKKLADEIEIPSIEEKAGEWSKVEGFQSFYWDERGGKIWLEVSEWDREVLFVHGLSSGLGSNPVGLDRGQLGREYVCQFKRVGPKVLLVARNLSFRARLGDELEKRAVDESFAHSVLWGGSVGAESDGTVLIDFTEFLLSDVHGVAASLKRAKQGEFQIDPKRSAVFPIRCKAFAENTELEATLTFAGKEPGPLVRAVTPAPHSVSLRQHLSFVKLPDENYVPRPHDPRCPSMFVSFADYSVPLDQPLEQRWIMRHRLQKRDPAAAVSPPVEPIVYYVDPGAPKPIRDALIEGASWWNDAFAAAGFENAFQVKLLPPDADPMDVRYNVIQWVHRRTRGWSYGRSVVDPRTGEIIKGHVTLGSLRVRQDRLLLEGLVATAENQGCRSCGVIGISEDTTLAALDEHTDPIQVALARIRQLSAHEVGHTLGFVHNFAASTYGDRASVMDYPAPRVNITDQNELDLSDAYGIGIGAWDTWGVQFAYSHFAPDADEASELQRLLRQAISSGYRFISDADARPPGAAHPLANLWDNGNDPVAELIHVMRVRQIALSRLGESNLADGQPLAQLEELLVPVYLHHRYQVDAAAKVIGGAFYTYAVKGDGQMAILRANETQQRQALLALLGTLDPRQLVVPAELLQKLPPKPYSSNRDIERFPSHTAPVFDPLAAARIAADMTISNLLQVDRVSRLAMQGDKDFGVQDLMVALVDVAWRPNVVERPLDDISRVIRQSLNEHVFQLIESPSASVAARSAGYFALDRIKQHVRTRERSSNNHERNFAKLVWAEIERFERRPHQTAQPPQPLRRPPGSPIGGSDQ